MTNDERAQIQLDMLNSFVKLYPKATSYDISDFAEEVGLTMLSSYEPNHDMIPERMSFARVVFTDRRNKQIDKEASYAIDWTRNEYAETAQS